MHTHKAHLHCRTSYNSCRLFRINVSLPSQSICLWNAPWWTFDMKTIKAFQPADWDSTDPNETTPRPSFMWYIPTALVFKKPLHYEHKHFTNTRDPLYIKLYCSSYCLNGADGNRQGMSIQLPFLTSGDTRAVGIKLSDIRSHEYTRTGLLHDG